MGISVGISAGVIVGVAVGVSVGVTVGVTVGVLLGVTVGVAVGGGGIISNCASGTHTGCTETKGTIASKPINGKPADNAPL